ncbi:unnamed protein product [Tilletia controversa]|uniref:PHD-type domain-containing protein n=3 Tax=Tilletia TaxID=13289 RepID=A0A8X7MW08_9BASI|nr:hypothetical protein CF336_g2306 [Tilletia laevis]KAE8202694.1 hypothetical protein CF328_g2072 [Tilletia controversa]KAE8263354.1 hypothetical protein A4X03_0g1743 [Tilletia caries]KAE8206929.1 hypothetical protein CF335_g1512 [Tilletia laevis]KAE8251548.1 hypothetical protein A4X06_0g2633 [Tilletia controversa]
MSGPSNAGAVAAAAAAAPEPLPDWGRVLLAGGTHWPAMGRKTSAAGKVANAKCPDLLAPHILRGLANVRMQRVFTSSVSSHVVFLSSTGNAYVYGRNESGQCGFPSATHKDLYDPLLLDRQANFSPPLPSSNLGDIVFAATGRNHTLLVTRYGAVYTAGKNDMGQCGHSKLNNIEKFTKITAGDFVKAKDNIAKVSAGAQFSLFCSESGKVYAAGSMEKGQLGNGRTGEHFASANRLIFGMAAEPIRIHGFDDRNIVEISSGPQHSFARSDDGYCYCWGFGGYGRLGLYSADDHHTPQLVGQFARDNIMLRAQQVITGPACTAVIDRQKQFWLCGKWKNSGDGGAGQGWLKFQYLQELMGLKMRQATLGGVVLFATADEDPSVTGPHDPTMNICWGQNAVNGELGLGEGKPKSATKPQRCTTLDGISIIDASAGQNTTFYIGRSLGDAFSSLPRFPPLETEPSEFCVTCQKGTCEDTLLECEKCESPYHLECLKPPLSEVPSTEWFCKNCAENLAQAAPPSPIGGSKKRKGSDDEDEGAAAEADGSDVEDVKPAAKKKKAASAASKKRK